MQKDAFDRDVQQIKEQGEADQIESEKIGYFKANKERLKEELRKLKNDLESEKSQLKEDRIKLEIFKNELNTKQKTIEGLRYNYIKGDQQQIMQKAEIIAQAKSKFVPIQPPSAKLNEVAAAGPAQPAEIRLNSQNNQPFNYEQYMKGLSDKISGSAPNSNAHIGSDFQAYIMRERESYMKSVHEIEKDATPMISSIHKYQMESVHRGNSKMAYSPDPYNSAYGLRANHS